MVETFCINVFATCVNVLTHMC